MSWTWRCRSRTPGGARHPAHGPKGPTPNEPGTQCCPGSNVTSSLLLPGHPHLENGPGSQHGPAIPPPLEAGGRWLKAGGDSFPGDMWPQTMLLGSAQVLVSKDSQRSWVQGGEADLSGRWAQEPPHRQASRQAGLQGAGGCGHRLPDGGGGARVQG